MHAWHSYAAHELLSLAFQTLFWAALTAGEECGRRRFADANELASFAVGELVTSVSARERKSPWAEFVASRHLPAQVDWGADGHEMRAAWRILERGTGPTEAVGYALHVLAALIARGSGDDPYAHLHFPAHYFARYPINLQSFRNRVEDDWSTRPMTEVVASLVTWALRTHWRVAMQKLSEKSARDTFKVRPLEGAILVVEAPPPTFSSPRIHRVVGILRDLGLIDQADHRPVVTPAGRGLLRDLLG
jgi:hypothetical protein